MLTRRIALLLVAVLAPLLSSMALAQSMQPPRKPVVTEVPFTLISMKNVRFPQPLRLGGARAPAVDTGMDRALLVRVEVPIAVYDGLPPSMEPYLYIGQRELRTYAVERPRGGKTLVVTYYLPGTADATTFDFGAPMVITIEHGRPEREAARYRGRSDLKTFQTQWLRTP